MHTTIIVVWDTIVGIIAIISVSVMSNLGYEDMTVRQNSRLTKTIKPDMKDYEEKKEKM